MHVLKTNYKIRATDLPDGVVVGSAVQSWAIQPSHLRLDMANSQAVLQSIGFLLSRAAVCDGEGLLTVSMEGLGRPLWVQAVLASLQGSAALVSNIPAVNIYLTMNSAAEGPISGSVAYLKFMAFWNEQLGSAGSFIRTASFGSMANATVRCVYWGLIGSR